MLTKEQKDKLHRAIDLATHRGECRYVVDGKPACVVAQLLVLEGVTVGQMKMWGTQIVTQGHLNEVGLSEYYADELRQIQKMWDDDDAFCRTDEDARDAMHRYVDVA